jgi:phospholipid transport system substrate-binding protein
MRLRHYFSIALLLICAQATAQANNGAQTLVMETSRSVLDSISAQRDDIRQHPDHLYKLVDDILLPHIDFKYMSRLVLGKHWRRANDDQRKAFVTQFRNLLIRTYATALFEYEGQPIEFLPLRATAEATDVTVRSVIQAKSGHGIPVNYGMYLKEGEWKLYDIAIDGISLVNNYRSSFGSQIRRNPDGLNSLINKLASHNQQAQK